MIKQRGLTDNGAGKQAGMIQELVSCVRPAAEETRVSGDRREKVSGTLVWRPSSVLFKVPSMPKAIAVNRLHAHGNFYKENI